jgi:hypothetical protein
MRQWELIGITDAEPAWTPPSPSPEQSADALEEGIDEERAVFLWTTDAVLCMRTVTDIAADLLGRAVHRLEGTDLIEVFGLAGDGLIALEAHVGALQGETGTFRLAIGDASVRCLVAPRHDAQDQIIGTFCLAVELVDLGSEDPAPTAADVA